MNGRNGQHVGAAQHVVRLENIALVIYSGATDDVKSDEIVDIEPSQGEVAQRAMRDVEGTPARLPSSWWTKPATIASTRSVLATERRLMVDILKVFAALALGYLLGSLNTAVIVGRLYGKDIRSHGSKSAGLTNALRVLGKSAAALVLAGDILKGIIACLIGLRLGVYVHSGEASDCVSLLAAGAGAVVGHNWPVYFGFKGGKGALTAAAVMFMVNWVMSLISLGFFVMIVALTRYVSLGTICASIVFVAISFMPVFGSTFYFGIFAVLMAVVIIFKHRENVLRLLSGTENRLTF